MDYKKIDCKDIHVGIRFSAPVFFNDGENMFLAEGKTAKQYHVDSLIRWKIPYLLTYGRVIAETTDSDNSQNDFTDVEELEELDELEEIDEVV